MRSEEYKIKSRVWIWNEEKGSWHFVSIDKEDASLIKKDWPWPRRGFGAIPVNVSIGKTLFKTSIFPQKDGSYLLPIKKSVREAQNIKKGDFITFKIRVIE